MEKYGSEMTNGGLEVQDGTGRACWKKHSTRKWATCPHTPAHGIQAAREKWRVGGFLAPFFEKSCRSHLCATDDAVRVGKYRRKKKSPENIVGKMLTVIRVF
uniref:Uncharacterized protein n=1 Tax=Vitis vinifera TaxID=29760 RepID=A5AYR2_VITVI|nr:hypothetical protein VITISV_032533 [Vitis vinifera]